MTYHSLLLKTKRLIQQYAVSLMISRVSVRVILTKYIQSMKSMLTWTLRDLRIWMRWVRRQGLNCLTSSQWTKAPGRFCQSFVTGVRRIYSAASVSSLFIISFFLVLVFMALAYFI